MATLVDHRHRLRAGHGRIGRDQVSADLGGHGADGELPATLGVDHRRPSRSRYLGAHSPAQRHCAFPEHLVISAEMAGRVVELPYQSGEVVPEGAAVLVLFDDDLEAQREALEADLNLVSTQLERNRTLEADALISQDQLDVLKARSLSLKAQIAVLDARLSRMTFRAPFKGTLGIYPQRLGDLMRFGEVLTTLTGLNPARWIDFKVPQGLAEIRVGDNVKVNDISGSEIGVAQVIAVSDAFAEGTRTYDVRASFPRRTCAMVRWCKSPSAPAPPSI